MRLMKKGQPDGPALRPLELHRGNPPLRGRHQSFAIRAHYRGRCRGLRPAAFEARSHWN